ncbi:MAG: nucleotide sugar dehydrogenase [Chloroflexota bacterium]
MTPIENVIEKFENRSTHVAVVGLGYVGLPLCIAFAKAGYQVTGIDIDERKVDSINRGESYIEDIPSSILQQYTRQSMGISTQTVGSTTNHPPSTTLHLSSRNQFSATTDYSILAECDAVSICVPTPLSKTGDPNIAYVVSAAEQTAKYLHNDMVVVLESTTYPGTTTEILLPHLEQNNQGFQVGQDFFLAFSPERIDPGRADWTVETMPKVMGGVTGGCLEVATAFYGAAVGQIIPVSSPDAAEMVKLFENTFRAVNIGLANELLLMCDKLGLDAWEVLDAAATKPFGFMKFTPGPGLGGHCIPVDPHYLSWKLRSLQYTARFIELASEINTNMPAYWVQRVQDALNEDTKSVKGSQILILGVAYKKDVSDMRESPSLDILHLLQTKGAMVQYHDPYVPSFSYDGQEFVSVPDLIAALEEADCVVIATDHSSYDWQTIVNQSNLLIDTRHVDVRG